MAFDAGSVVAKLALDLTNFKDGISDAKKALKDLTKESATTSQKISAFGVISNKVGKTLMAGVTLPVMAAGTAAIKMASDFDTGMSEVGAITQATAEEMAQMRKVAIDLGASTAFSASEASEGMANLASAGFSVSEVINAMPGMMDLAAASGIDLASASSIAATSLRGFGLEASESTRVANVFAKAAADTNADTVGMGEAMKYVAPVANTMGLSLEETAAAIGKMSDAGIMGSQAGTTLRTALVRLAKPSDDAAGAMAAMGFNAFDANGKMLPLKDIIGQLEKGMASYTDEQKQNAMATIFGTESLSGMLALVNGGPASLDALTKSLENSDGAAAKMAETMMDNLGGSIEEMKGAIETAAITMGTVLVPTIRKMADGINDLVSKFNGLSTSQQENIVKWALMAASIGPIVFLVSKIIALGSMVAGIFTTISGVMMVLTVGTAAATPTIAALAGAFTLLTGPVGLVIAGLAAVAIGGRALYKTLSEDVIPEVELFGEGISEATAEAIGAYMDLDEKASASLMNLKVNSKKVTEESSNEIVASFKNMGQQIKEGMDADFNESNTTLSEFFNRSYELTDEAEAKILEKMRLTNEAKKAETDGYTTRIQEILQAASSENRKLTSEEQVEISKIQMKMKESAVNTLSETELESKAIMERMKAQAGNLTAQQAAEVVRNSLEQKNKAVQNADAQYNETVKAIIKQRDETKVISADQAARLIEDARLQRDNVVKTAETMHQEVVKEGKLQSGELVDSVDWSTGEVKSKYQVMKENVIKKTTEMRNSINAELENIKQETVKNWEATKEGVKEKVDEMKAGIHERMAKIQASVTEDWNQVVAFFKGIDLREIGRNIMQGFKDGITSKFESIKTSIKEIAGNIPQWAKTVLDIHSPSRVMKGIGANVTEGLANGIDGGVNLVKAASIKMLDAVFPNYAQKASIAENDIKTFNNVIASATKSSAQEIKEIRVAAEREREEITKRSNSQIAEIQAKARDNKRKLTAAEIRKIEKLNQDAEANRIKSAEKETQKLAAIDKSSNSEKLDSLKKYVDQRKNLEQMTVAQEVAFWKQAVTYFKQGTDEKIQAQINYNKALDTLNKAQFDKEKTYISDKKYYNQLSLSEELRAYQNYAKQYKEGSEERIYYEKEIYRVKNEITNQLKAINEDYLANVKSLNDQLIAEEQRLNSEYEKALSDRQKTLMSFAGIFDSASKKEIGGGELLENLKGQVSIFKDWQKGIDGLSAKGIDEELLEELRQMGPKAAGEIEALNSLSDAKLAEYVSLWKEKGQLAKEQATEELVGLKEETATKIEELHTTTAEKLEELRLEWAAKMSEITKGSISEMDILAQSMPGMGKNVIQGLINGLDSMTGALMARAQSIADMVRSTIASALDIHSPSRVMEKLGKFTGEGFAVGIESSLATIRKQAIKMADTVTGVDIPDGTHTPDNPKGMGGTQIVQNLNVYSPTELSPSEVSRQSKMALQELALLY